MKTRRVKLSGKQIELQLRDDVDDSVAGEIFKYREYRSAEDVIINAKTAIIDAGAHAGYFTIYCRILNSKVKILALEPEERNYAFMLENFRLNNVKNVEPLSAALTGESGDAELLISDDSQNHSLKNAGFLTSEKAVKVNTCALPDLAKKYKLKCIDLVKMDIEGGEYDVISNLSAKDFLIINFFIFEYHNFGSKNHKVLEQILRENHFGVQVFPSKFDKKMGFIFAKNKLLRRK